MDPSPPTEATDDVVAMDTMITTESAPTPAPTTSATAGPTAGMRTIVDPNRRNNELVPESDYQAAVQVFAQHTMTALAEEKDSICRLLKQTVLESMVQQLAQITAPVSDEAFHRYCSDMDDQHEQEQEQRQDQKQQQQQQQQQMNEKSMNENTDNHDSSNMVVEFEMNDFEEDELLDTTVLERVRNLRRQVREQAEQVGKVRERVLNKAHQLTQQQLHHCLGQTRSTNTREEDTSRNRNESHNDDDDDDDDDDENVVDVQGEAAIQDMHGALQQTKKHLHWAETKVPTLLEKWQRQMDVVEEGEQWTLSQTEQTIRTRTKDTILPIPETTNAQDRFAAFLVS